jgi:hypothetical protein
MLAGPKSGLTAVTSEPGAAIRDAAAWSLRVIEAVVFGLTTSMRMRGVQP